MNHTKGPWTFDGHGINDSEGNRICKVTNTERYDLMAKPVVLDKEFEANSLLIASAPELLQVCKELLEADISSIDVQRQIRAKVRKLIRKVGGK